MKNAPQIRPMCTASPFGGSAALQSWPHTRRTHHMAAYSYGSKTAGRHRPTTKKPSGGITVDTYRGNHLHEPDRLTIDSVLFLLYIHFDLTTA